jgi:tetratricopeptide (TPR) repeat protein
MSKRQKSQIKGNTPTAQRKRIGIVWICALVVAGIAVTAVIALKLKQSSRSGGSAPGGVPVASAIDERELRREQLDATQKLLTEFPTNDDVVYLAGLVYEDQGDTDQAMKLWTRSIELDATRGDANESLGQTLLLRDDYAAAEKYLRRALEIDTNSVNARFRLAKTLSQQGRLQEALVVLERIETLSAEGRRLMGEICQQLHQHERARTNYEAAIRLKADFPEAYYGLAQTFSQLGETSKSREMMEKSSALRKESDEQARHARADFDSLAVTRQSVARTHTDVGRVYMVLGQPARAEELWLRAAALDSRNVLCRLQLAVLYQQTRRDREALDYYEQAASLDPRDGLTHLNMGRVCMKLNNVDRAQAAFKEVMRLEPKRPEGYSALAQLYLQTRSNLAEAERLATVAAELAKEAPYFALLSQVCVQNGNQDGALSAINRAIELQPANPQFVQMRQTILAVKR